MTTERKVSLLFATNAVINWVVSLPGIINPAAAAELFGGAARNDPFAVRNAVKTISAVRNLIPPALRED